ncbi:MULTISPECIES: DUF58 domain-containing protein [unclassified Pannonibacter]|uniref:DUF58 domain-containing protein n=1 Tax=unclassified Pannonibacter TaxID=2627228 RepID=UPI001648C479|nr:MULTISPECIES: DUF58 domain-containing protein [unclassified Pannonibacter]
MAGTSTAPAADTSQTSGLGPGMLASARTVAEALPELLVEARQVSNTVATGWHGRRRAGPGETFWQFRPFSMGEPARRIDWRRSARDEHLYVREREWEAAHTVWLWADLSPSMNFGSKLAPVVKRDRALVLMLALASMLSGSGERVGLPGLTRPLTSRDAPERMAATLAHAPRTDALPDTTAVRRFSDVVLIADFLDPIASITEWVGRVASTGARGHLVQILDPIEESFPFDGRVEFRDPEGGLRLTTGRAEGWREAYQARLAARKAQLREIAGRAGWSHILHHTDRPATEPLLALHGRLSGQPGVMASGMGGR